jgi:aspartyl/asparaginyl beta-hydroxylase (cupin superfamily)
MNRDIAVAGILDQVRRKYPDSLLDRIEPCLLGQPLVPNDPLHRPGFLYLPFLSKRPWHEADEHQWTAKFRQEFNVIRQECLSAHATGAFSGYAEPPGAPSFWQGNWQSFYLLHSRVWFADNAAACPRTTALVRGVPGLDEYALFSALGPGVHINPHAGPWNVRLTFHFGIQIPSAARIRVGSTFRKWEEGSFLVFDDSFEHEVLNPGPEVRFVLMFTVWNPELSAAEIDVLRRYDSLFPVPAQEKYIADLLTAQSTRSTETAE